MTTRVDGDAGVRVASSDTTGIDANSELTVSSVSTNTLDALKDVAGTLGLDDYQYTTNSGEQQVSPGLTVTGDPLTGVLAETKSRGRSICAGQPARTNRISQHRFV